MSSRSSMRLLLVEHGITGGIETVNIQLVKEFTELVEQVVWVMSRSRFDYFQQFLPASDRLIYQSQFRPPERWFYRGLKKAAHFALRHRNVPARPALKHLRQAYSHARLRQIIREFNITHCFCNWILYVDVPRISVPIGVMLMDVRWKRLPETFRDGEIDRIDKQFCDWLTTSKFTFPVSQATASDIKRFYPWYTGSARVVPHGARNSDYHESTLTAAADTLNNRPLFYYPAATQPHKNHLTLFEACAKLFAKGHDFDVVLTGTGTERFAKLQPDDEVSVELGRAFLQKEQALFRGRIKPRGYCERAEVETLYNRCTAVVLPSAFEGFGLPLIEALQTGAEIICSDIPAHREQLTRYGCFDEVTLIAAGDATALAAEMEKVLTASRQPLSRKRSRLNALKRWTWRDAAAAYVEALADLPPVPAA